MSQSISYTFNSVLSQPCRMTAKEFTKTTLILYVMVNIPQFFIVGGTSGTSNSSNAHESDGLSTILRWHRSVLDLPQRDLKEIICTRNTVVWYVCVSGKFLISVVNLIRSWGQYAFRSVTAISFSWDAIPLYKQLSDFWASPKLGSCMMKWNIKKIKEYINPWSLLIIWISFNFSALS